MGHGAFQHLSLRGVGMRFAERTALQDISFDVPSGSICVIVGPNGAGKTTLVRMLAGAQQPTSGTIAWVGATGRPRAALVAQTVALYPFMTLRENCLASGRMEGLRGAPLTARAEEAMARTLCSGMRHQLAGRLSGGFQRRAAIAAALMGDAPLMILDEPTTGLDAEATQAISAIVMGLTRAGRTIVLTTHDFGLADDTADLAVFLKRGRLVAADAPKRLCDTLFAEKKHVELSFAEEPTPGQAAYLAALEATRLTPKRYGIFSDADPRGGLAVLAALRSAGLAIRELRVREPGTAILFERFCLDRPSP